MTENTVLDNNVSSIIKNSNNPIYRFRNEDNSVFPDWEELKIGDLCTIYKGAPLSKADIANSGTPFILYGELYTTYGEIAYQINRKTEKIVDKKYYSKIGDVVVPTSGETAEEISTATCIMKDDVILAGDLNIFRGSKIDGRILSYLLNHKKKYEIASVAQGASIIHIKADDIKKIKIKVPCKTEQEKIASFLTSIDNLISTQESNISILETYNRGLISKIFKQEIRFKDDNENAFPDWVMEKVKDLFEITRGCVLAADNIKTNRDQMYPYPVYSSQTKNNGLMGYYSKFLYENAITWTTDGANAGTVNFRKGKFYCTNVCGVLLNKDGYANRCIAEIIACKSKRYVSYVGNPKLMNNVMAEIPILIPSLEEQEKISNFLTSLDNVLQAEKNYLEQLKTIKKGLLQQMFV